MTAEQFVDLLEGVTHSGGGWKARCPHHEDNQASLQINEGEDRFFIFCHAGCDTELVMQSVGLTLADLFQIGRAHV